MSWAACIGVSFAVALAEARQGLITALVLQNPIGLVEGNRAAIDGEFNKWAEALQQRPDVDPKLLPVLGERMFGSDFLFSVSRNFVAGCEIPMLLMPGDDLVHPAETSADIARLAKRVEVVSPWKGPPHRDAAMEQARSFFISHSPANP